MRLKEKRKENGLTQVVLANKSGVSIRAIRSYESGARDINKASVEILKKLAETLGCTIEDIME